MTTLIEILHDKNITANKLAYEVGVSYSTISRILLGKTANPHKRTLMAIARELSLSLAQVQSAIPGTDRELLEIAKREFPKFSEDPEKVEEALNIGYRIGQGEGDAIIPEAWKQKTEKETTI